MHFLKISIYIIWLQHWYFYFNLAKEASNGCVCSQRPSPPTNGCSCLWIRRPWWSTWTAGTTGDAPSEGSLSSTGPTDSRSGRWSATMSYPNSTTSPSRTWCPDHGIRCSWPPGTTPGRQTPSTFLPLSRYLEVSITFLQFYELFLQQWVTVYSNHRLQNSPAPQNKCKYRITHCHFPSFKRHSTTNKNHVLQGKSKLRNFSRLRKFIE